MISRFSLLSRWDRFVARLAAVGMVAVSTGAVAEVVAGGWGFFLGYTTLAVCAVLVGVAALSLVRRLSAPPGQRTWTGVWLPLAAAAIGVALAVLTFAAMRLLASSAG